MNATEAVQAELDAIEQQIIALRGAVEARRDTDTVYVNWSDVGDLAKASEYIQEALETLGA